MINRMKKHWFILGLMLVFCLVICDVTGTVTAFGKWFKGHHGTDAVMFAIFLASGLMLNIRGIQRGSGDLKGLVAALFLIFIVAPVIALFFGKLPINHEIAIGFFLVSVAPTTLSSGVVMTTVAGGSMPHALMVTLVSNTLSVVTVPLTLPILLENWGAAGPVAIDRQAMVLKLGLLVLLPLIIGMVLKKIIARPSPRPVRGLQTSNQLLILLMVTVGLSQARGTLLDGGIKIVWIVFLVAAFHGLMLLSAFFSTGLLRLPLPVRKSVVFMGGQKTLPLTLMLQVTLFPACPLSLVVCVLHHLLQLFMDGYLVGIFRTRLGD
jgi:sodium/bile acid cotransporter 7